MTNINLRFIFLNKLTVLINNNNNNNVTKFILNSNFKIVTIKN